MERIKVNNDKTFRNKIVHVSFLLSILVVYIHANNLKYYGLNEQIDSIPYIIQTFIGETIGSCVVPVFFMISGFLFFYNMEIREKLIFENIKKKQIKRINTILIPYLIWNTFGMIFYMIVPRISIISEFINGGYVEFNITNIINGVILHEYYFPLWYLKDLIVLIILSPIIVILLSKKTISIIFITFIGILQLMDIKLYILRTSSIFFFVIGCYFAIYTIDVFKKVRHKREGLIFLILFFTLSLIRFININEILNKFLYLISPILLWISFDVFKVEEEPLEFERQSFFIYCSHIIIVTTINKILLKIFKYRLGDLGVIFNYIISPIITILIIRYLYIYMNSYLPKIYKIICGNRG